PAAPPENTPEEHNQGQPESPSLGKVYALYDSGLNERLNGNNALAVARLTEARQVVEQGGPQGSDLEEHIDYWRARALEKSGNLSEATHILSECLRLRPNFIEASMRLSIVAARKGQAGAALRYAREAVRLNGNDPRTHAILAIMLEKNGLKDEAAY